MNIFYLSPDVKECAEMHNDKHCVKMILEYAQLLSTAHRVLDGKPLRSKTDSGRNVVRYVLDNELDGIFYSATHINHPSAVWVRQSNQNYNWLANLLLYLCEEYTYRYGKVHKIERDGLCYVLFKNLPKNIPIADFTEPTPAMPDEVKVMNDSIQSYRNYYNNNKQHLASWKKRQVPNWFMENR